MSEIVLSNTNYDDYSNGSMMMDINPGLVQKSSNSTSSPSTNDFDSVVTSQHQQQYSTYPAYAFQPLPMGYPPVPTTNYQPISTRLGYYDNERQQQQQPNSPESISSSSTPSPPPTNTASTSNHTLSYPTSANSNVIATNELITPLSASTSSSTTSSATSNKSTNNRFNNPTTARVKEMITRANSVPMEFYHTEFLEYSKETYEKKMESRRNKRKRPACTVKEQQQEMVQQQQQFTTTNKKQKIVFAEEEEEEEKDDSDDETNDDDEKLDQSQLSSAEIRRQIHIQSEQKRRAQIKDGFDELRKHLPGCNNKKMSKAALLTRTVQQLQHLKGMQNELLSEVERLLQENEALKKFQHGVLQRQAMEKMYTF